MAQPNNAPLSMPAMEQPLVALGSSGQLQIQFVWWRFLFGLFKRSQADIPFLVDDAVTAAGISQAAATALTGDWNVVATTPLNAGVRLPNFGAGFPAWVWNAGANPLRVYPELGITIDAGAVNAPYLLAAGKAQIFSQITPVLIRSLQLG